MVKLIFLDIDGTLRHEVLGIPYSAIQAIQQLRAKNCRVVICTGRSLGSISDDILALVVDGIISGGGSTIHFHNERLKATAFPQPCIQETLTLLKKEDVAFTFESTDQVFMNEQAYIILNQMNLMKQKNLKNSQKQYVQEKIIYEDNMHLYQAQPIHKICLWDQGNVFPKVQLILGDLAEIAQQDTFNHLEYVEIVQRGSHKGDAITFLQNYLGIKKEETICFGDGLNDIEMFRACGLAIAMENAHEKLKEIADSTCENVMNDGIFLELKRRKMVE